jgi:hypothetical protein
MMNFLQKTLYKYTHIVFEEMRLAKSSLILSSFLCVLMNILRTKSEIRTLDV